jgi:cytochrome c553
MVWRVLARSGAAVTHRTLCEMRPEIQITRSVRIGILALLAASVPAHADTPDGRAIVLQGSAPGAIACATCHGADGFGPAGANFIRLAGQPEGYLAKQLRDFRDGARDSVVMKSIAAPLSDAEIAAVARYFAAQSPPTVPAGKPAEPSLMRRGELLATRGNWSVEIPACFQCHGGGGRGVAPHFPAIAGQPAAYTVEQIEAWRRNARRNDPVRLMQTVAKRLSRDEIQTVATYLASLPPRTTPGREEAGPRREQRPSDVQDRPSAGGTP